VGHGEIVLLSVSLNFCVYLCVIVVCVRCRRSAASVLFTTLSLGQFVFDLLFRLRKFCLLSFYGILEFVVRISAILGVILVAVLAAAAP
jgi:hypothetical protein